MVLQGKTVARKLYENYIYGTDPKAIIEVASVHLGKLSQELTDTIGAEDVWISSRALKHIHESRSDKHFEIILDNLQYLISDPEALYFNLPGKKGTHLLVKELGDYCHFFCSLERVKLPSSVHFEVVTVAPCNPGKYLKSYEQLWVREDA